MGCEHKWNVEELLRQKAGHRHIPGVRMHDVDGPQRYHLREIEAQSFEGRLELLLCPFSNHRPGLAASHIQVSVVNLLITPAVNFDLDLLPKLTAQVLNVNSSAAVDIRRIFACHQTNSQGKPPVCGIDHWRDKCIDSRIRSTAILQPKEIALAKRCLWPKGKVAHVSCEFITAGIWSLADELE